LPDTTLAARFETMLSELRVTKAAFARSLGVTPNYIYLLTSGKMTSCSQTLVLLIECKYGYSAAWVFAGEGEKTAPAAALMERVLTLPDKKRVRLEKYLNRLRGSKEDE